MDYTLESYFHSVLLLYIWRCMMCIKRAPVRDMIIDESCTLYVLKDFNGSVHMSIEAITVHGKLQKINWTVKIFFSFTSSSLHIVTSEQRNVRNLYDNPPVDKNTWKYLRLSVKITKQLMRKNLQFIYVHLFVLFTHFLDILVETTRAELYYSLNYLWKG